jgi:hypothetical protein
MGDAGEKRTMQNECYSCKNVRVLEHGIVQCKRPPNSMTWHPYFYWERSGMPDRFAPFHKKMWCSNYEEDIRWTANSLGPYSPMECSLA